MMRFRFSIIAIMGAIVAVAVAVVALREGTAFWAGITGTVTGIVLLGAVLSVIIVRGPRRAAWGGFALFAWVYALWCFGPWSDEKLEAPPLVASEILDEVHPWIHPEPEYIPDPNYKPRPVTAASDVFVGAGPVGFTSNPHPYQEPPMILKPGSREWAGRMENYRQVGHCLAIWLFGGIGAAWARFASERGRAVANTRAEQNQAV